MPLNYYRSDLWVKTVLGPAVPGAQIYVCTQPANVTPPITPPRTTPVPWIGPNPQALIYSDDGLTPITQPIITDGFGHADYYVLPGLYTVVILYNGNVQEVLVDQSIGGIGSAGGSGVLLETNGSPNFNQAILNLNQGAGILLFSDNLGNTTVTNAYSAPPALPDPDVATFAYWSATANPGANIDQPWTFVLDNSEFSSGGGGGSDLYNFIPATATSYQACQTAVSGDAGISYMGTTIQIWPTRATSIKSTVLAYMNNTAVAGEFFQGISNVPANAGNTPITGDFVGVAIYKGPAAPFGNLQLTCSNGGAVTNVDTGVPASDSTGTVGIRYVIDITLVDGIATMFVNGTQVATCSTNIPTTNPLFIARYHHALNGGADTYIMYVNTEYIYASNASPSL
jgi:hypothetical protein